MTFQVTKTEGDVVITYGGWIDDNFNKKNNIVKDE